MEFFSGVYGCARLVCGACDGIPRGWRQLRNSGPIQIEGLGGGGEYRVWTSSCSFIIVGKLYHNYVLLEILALHIILKPFETGLVLLAYILCFWLDSLKSFPCLLISFCLIYFLADQKCITAYWASFMGHPVHAFAFCVLEERLPSPHLVSIFPHLNARSRL